MFILFCLRLLQKFEAKRCSSAFEMKAKQASSSVQISSKSRRRWRRCNNRFDWMDILFDFFRREIFFISDIRLGVRTLVFFSKTNAIWLVLFISLSALTNYPNTNTNSDKTIDYIYSICSMMALQLINWEQINVTRNGKERYRVISCRVVNVIIKLLNLYNLH